MMKKNEDSWNDFKKRYIDGYNKITKNIVYDQTEKFTFFINKYIENDDYLKILDCACGNGNQTNYISQFFSSSKVTGFDFNPLHINYAKKKFKNINWLVHNLNENFRYSDYDIMYTLQTLSILENGYDRFFSLIKENPPKHFAGSVLLWEGNASFKCNIKLNNENFIYNFYNKNDFINDLKGLGFNKVKIDKFKITIDLKKEKKMKDLGTYTINNESEKIMISGPFIMNWFFFIAS